MRLLTLLALIAGCAPLRPLHLPDDERAAIDAAVAGWEAAGLPSCPSMQLADVRRTERPCGSPGWPCLGQSGGRPVVWLPLGMPVVDSQGGPIVHELMHHASSACLGNADPGHRDERVWIAAGGPTSAQGRARELLSHDP